MAAMSSLKTLPVGFRLNPRDEDLISFYLMRKLQNVPDPDGNCLIPEFNIYDCEPWDLIPLFDGSRELIFRYSIRKSGYCDDSGYISISDVNIAICFDCPEMASIKSNGLECFFFCPLYKCPNRGKNIRKIAEGKGYWHETGKGRQPQDTDRLKWGKRIFCHRVGTQGNAEQTTDWVMHEFRLTPDRLTSDESTRLLDHERFVLCRITRKPKKLLSASVGKKRKAGSAHSEPHQETSPEASVHMNADEVPMIMTHPVSDKTSDDFLNWAIMAEALTPESDIISPFYSQSQTSPNMNTGGDHTGLPLDISVADYDDTEPYTTQVILIC